MECQDVVKKYKQQMIKLKCNIIMFCEIRKSYRTVEKDGFNGCSVCKTRKMTEYLQREGILLDMKFGHACQIYWDVTREWQHTRKR